MTVTQPASADGAARTRLIGAASVVAAVTCFSINDVAIKFLSSGYALHQIVLLRSLIGLVFFAAVIMPASGGWRVLRTQRLGAHLLRGLSVVFANLCFFLGLSVMPLADAVAIFFVAPLLIAVFSAVFLGELVGPWRWGAIGLGMAGVAVMLRPGGDGIALTALFPLAAAAGYATLHTLTRRIGLAESAATMSLYVQLTFIVVSGAIGLALGDGRFDAGGGGALGFLTRAWVWPDPADYWLLALIGVGSATGGYFISQAYRICEAGFAAPFEYVAMPMAVIGGVVVFGDWPDGAAWLGMALIVGGGLLLLWREAVQGARAALRGPKYRR